MYTYSIVHWPKKIYATPLRKCRHGFNCGCKIYIHRVNIYCCGETRTLWRTNAIGWPAVRIGPGLTPLLTDPVARWLITQCLYTWSAESVRFVAFTIAYTPKKYSLHAWYNSISVNHSFPWPIIFYSSFLFRGNVPWRTIKGLLKQYSLMQDCTSNLQKYYVNENFNATDCGRESKYRRVSTKLLHLYMTVIRTLYTGARDSQVLLGNSKIHTVFSYT